MSCGRSIELSHCTSVISDAVEVGRNAFPPPKNKKNKFGAVDHLKGAARR